MPLGRDPPADVARPARPGPRGSRRPRRPRDLPREARDTLRHHPRAGRVLGALASTALVLGLVEGAARAVLAKVLARSDETTRRVYDYAFLGGGLGHALMGTAALYEGHSLPPLRPEPEGPLRREEAVRRLLPDPSWRARAPAERRQVARPRPRREHDLRRAPRARGGHLGPPPRGPCPRALRGRLATS